MKIKFGRKENTGDVAVEAAQEEQLVGRKRKKAESEGYVLRKNRFMSILRICLWAMLVIIALKGVISSFQRDRTEVMDQMIRDFKANYSSFTNQNEEVMSFAQSFAREYLTYTVRGEEDYKKRLKEYVAQNFFGSDAVLDFSASASAVYVQAYRMEDYTDSQKDVFVRAEVEYTTRSMVDGASYTENSTKETVTLKIPVYCRDGRYAVECVPMVVNDSVWLEKYSPEKVYGNSLPDETVSAIETLVANFLKAYCEQDASVIDYYLDVSADKESFKGLAGRVTFKEVSDIRCCQGENDIICTVSYKVRDTGNNATLLQKINLTIGKSGQRYYVKTMDARTGNLKNN